jgi:hypothetical protein
MIFVFGPYLGSFEYEISNFRPYVEWLNHIYSSERIYLCTHFNRYFLYDSNNVEMPVYGHLTRDELNQNGHLHNLIKIYDYNLISKDIKEEVSRKESCSKKNIKIVNIGYTKSVPVIPVYKKIHKRIDIDFIPSELRNLSLFIPMRNEKKSIEMYKYIREIDENIVVIGDMKSPLSNKNVLLKNVDYLENGWKYIVGAITYAKYVICPLSYWTLICNLQGSRVFSWGDSPSLYRVDGVYGFGNKRATILPKSDVRGALKNFIRGM